MSRRTETCVVWTCDDCNEEYGEDDGTIHLTADESPTGWEYIDGKDVCDQCLLRRECAENGHECGEWGPSYWPPDAAEEYRWCIRCDESEGPRPRQVEPTEVVDLVAALRASVEAAKRRREARESGS